MAAGLQREGRGEGSALTLTDEAQGGGVALATDQLQVGLLAGTEGEDRGVGARGQGDFGREGEGVGGREAAEDGRGAAKGEVARLAFAGIGGDEEARGGAVGGEMGKGTLATLEEESAPDDGGVLPDADVVDGEGDGVALAVGGRLVGHRAEGEVENEVEVVLAEGGLAAGGVAHIGGGHRDDLQIVAGEGDALRGPGHPITVPRGLGEGGLVEVLEEARLAEVLVSGTLPTIPPVKGGPDGAAVARGLGGGIVARGIFEDINLATGRPGAVRDHIPKGEDIARRRRRLQRAEHPESRPRTRGHIKLRADLHPAVAHGDLPQRVDRPRGVVRRGPRALPSAGIALVEIGVGIAARAVRGRQLQGPAAHGHVVGPIDLRGPLVADKAHFRGPELLIQGADVKLVLPNQHLFGPEGCGQEHEREKQAAHRQTPREERQRG